MSTRSITKFLGYSGTVQAIVYRRSDGYPEGAGRDINQFLNECKKLKDPRLDDASYLAAKYVAFLANMFNNSFQFIEENGKCKMKKVQHANRLDFLGVGIVDATFDDFAYSYTIDCKKLDAKGKPEVICYDSEGVVTPIPRGYNNWQFGREDSRQ